MWNFLINLHNICYNQYMTSILNYINNDFQPFDLDEKISFVQDFFADNSFSHFPVIKDGIYLGCVAADSADGFDSDKTLSNHKYSFDGFFARKNMIYLEVMHIFAKNHSNILPILDNDNNYIGYYEQENITAFFNETPFLAEPGHVIVIEKGILDYSMGQITQIVESNNGRLLGCFISNSSLSSVQITLKIGLGSMNEMLQSFRRYEYDILSAHEEDVFISNLKERSEYLEKYLSM